MIALDARRRPPRAPVLNAEIRPCSDLAALAGALFRGAERRDGMWTMLSVYIDESGAHQGSRFLIIAGLVASPPQWDRLERQWLKILAESGVKVFHAAGCASGNGAFKGWPIEDRNRLSIRLINVIQRTASYRIWTALSISDYQHLKISHQGHTVQAFSQGTPKRLYSRMYSLAAAICVSRGDRLAAERGSDYMMPYVFDQGPRGANLFHNFERILREREKWVRHGILLPGTFMIGTITKGDHRRIPALQAADVLAYETYRYFADQVDNQPPQPRMQMQALFGVKDGGGLCLGADRLSAAIEGMHLLAKGIAPLNKPYDVLDKDHLIRVERPAARLERDPPPRAGDAGRPTPPEERPTRSRRRR